jgi:hypothetical protein
MNSFIVTLIQLLCVSLVWSYALTSAKFVRVPASSMSLIAARFLASMLMHINVEKDVQLGIQMMKYCANHYENFTNPHAAFFVAFLHFFVSLAVEINVIIIFTSI